MSHTLTTKHQDSLALSWKLCFALALVAVVMMAPDFANAKNPFESGLCTVAGWLSSGVGKALATLAITIVGIGALLGKVSWGMAIIVGIGVIIVFGASGIVEAIDPKAKSASCS